MKIAYYFVHSFEVLINTSCPSASLSGGLFLYLRTCQPGKIRANCAQTFGRIYYESLSLWLRP